MLSSKSGAEVHRENRSSRWPAFRHQLVQRRQYIALLKQKRSAFWTERINAEQAYPCRLWRSFDELFGRGFAPALMPFLFVTAFVQATHRTSGHPSSFQRLV